MSICINPICSKINNSDDQLFCQNCSSELLLEGRYRVTRKLGTGGFGKTYEVSDRQGTTKVLKVLSDNHPKYVQLFQQEAQILTQLDHQGIPQVEPDAYFTFLPRDSSQVLHCLVMEKINGLDLQQYLRKRGSPIDQRLAIQWLGQLADILKAVHNCNFFHRDIKPSNIMLRANGPLVLIDFGTAREITGSFVVKQAAGEITGVMSAGYTPPEQLNGQALPQSDFFALGRTFVYLLTSNDPSSFYDPYTDELHWRNAASGIAPQFANFLDRLMARFPNQRPQTAEIILQQLEEIKDISYLPPSSQLTKLVNNPVVQPTNNHYLPGTNSLPPGHTTQSLHTSASFLPKTELPLEEDFIKRCTQELAEVIGPMASIICKRTLKKNSQVSAREFVEALAEKIPNQKQAFDFKCRLLP